MTTTVEIVGQTAERFENADLFYGHGTDNAWDEAVSLVFHVLQLPFDATEEKLQRRLSSEEVAEINALVDERVNTKKPLPYLINQAYFFGLPFYVDERVIVPRSPIAELIEAQFSPWLEQGKVKHVLDLCTGSACIAIACAYAFEEAKVDAVDIDPKALEVAAINCKELEAEDQVELIQSDLFTELTGRKYDLIVSNPPYVSPEEMQTLPQEYNHEPRHSLEAADEGLELALTILRKAPEFLNDGGVLVVEVGNSWEALAKRFPEVPFLWLEFEFGGEGVFLLTKEQLLASQEQFK